MGNWVFNCFSGVFYRQNSLLVHTESWCQYVRYREVRGGRALFSVSVTNIEVRADFILLFCPKFLGWLHVSHLAPFPSWRTPSVPTISPFFLFHWDVSHRAKKIRSGYSGWIADCIRLPWHCIRLLLVLQTARVGTKIVVLVAFIFKQ